jgi:hypothetical protein
VRGTTGFSSLKSMPSLPGIERNETEVVMRADEETNEGRGGRVEGTDTRTGAEHHACFFFFCTNGYECRETKSRNSRNYPSSSYVT